MIRSSTMIVRITILRLNRKTVTRSTEKAKNIAQIQSSKWECSWMEMVFHLLFHYSQETQIVVDLINYQNTDLLACL